MCCPLYQDVLNFSLSCWRDSTGVTVLPYLLLTLDCPYITYFHPSTVRNKF